MTSLAAAAAVVDGPFEVQVMVQQRIPYAIDQAVLLEIETVGVTEVFESIGHLLAVSAAAGGMVWVFVVHVDSHSAMVTE